MVLVALAAVCHHDLVAPAIAQALRVQPAGSRPPFQSLAEHLRGRHVLLLLDNFEHVAAAAPLVAALLAARPRLKVLAISRAPQHVPGERVVPVAPLALPGLTGPLDVEYLAACGAMRLLVERAQEVQPDFRVTAANAPALAAICRLLDGLPLAIELAATRLAYLAPSVLLARLEGASGHTPLQVLTGGACDLPARHQTMAWSHDLLDPGEQVLFRRLAVFAGGCSAEAAEAVCASPGDPAMDIPRELASLVDKSLLLREAGNHAQAGGDGDHAQAGCHGQPRFTMLRTIRAYALERLAAGGEAEELRIRHAAYYLALAEAAGPELIGPGPAAWLEREHDNLRAARQWAQESAGTETGLRPVGAAELPDEWAIVATLPEQPERVA